MHEERALEVSNSPGIARLPATQVVDQIRAVQEIMRDVMVEGEHYGTIPGCGKKKALFKSGAEKLGFTFRFSPTFPIMTMREISNASVAGHREYEIVCRLTHIGSGVVVAEGVGLCSTMESKYRYRTKRVVLGGVPGAYWKHYKSNPAKAKAILEEKCGKGGRPRKVDGEWLVVSEQKVENKDIADVYNTVLKMAKKRAYVDCIISSTACSDIFTQDVGDAEDDATPPPQPRQQPTPQKEPRPSPASEDEDAPPIDGGDAGIENDDLPF